MSGQAGDAQDAGAQRDDCSAGPGEAIPAQDEWPQGPGGQAGGPSPFPDPFQE